MSEAREHIDRLEELTKQQKDTPSHKGDSVEVGFIKGSHAMLAMQLVQMRKRLLGKDERISELLAEAIDIREAMSEENERNERIESKLDFIMTATAKTMDRRPTAEEVKAIKAGGGNPEQSRVTYTRTLLDEWQAAQKRGEPVITDTTKYDCPRCNCRGTVIFDKEAGYLCTACTAVIHQDEIKNNEEGDDEQR